MMEGQIQPAGQPGGAPAGGPPAQIQQAGGAGGGTQYEITHGPSFAMLRVDMQPGQVIVAEAGSMVARHSPITMEPKLNAPKNGGIWGKIVAFFIAIIRKIVGGETFFVNHFESSQGGSVWISPSMSGQVAYRRLNGDTITLSTGSFLAMSGNVNTRLRFGGWKSLFAQEGAFFLECTGQGELWYTSYGAIQEIDVNGGYIVDTGHIVGFEGNLTWTIGTPGGGMMGFFASGEGLVCKFQGQGKVYIQSRNVGALVGWLSPMLHG